MISSSHNKSKLTALLLMAFLTGCARIPSLNVEGSFLPSWMLCLALGSLAGLLIRRSIIRARMEHRIAPSVVFYPSLVIAIACLLWLVFFR